MPRIDWDIVRKETEGFLRDRNITWPRCGFSIGAGWLPIIKTAIDEMIAAGWDRNLDQVKQKFGQCRIYVGKSSDEINKIIAKAERECNIACEYCGKPHGLTTPLSGLSLCNNCKDL